LEGRVEVSRAGSQLATLGPGDLFGEILYFSDNKVERSTTIRSLGPALLLEIKAAALNAASSGCQVQFNKACMRLLVERLSEANRSRLAAR
jgi:non-specific serine/threonine protein kinase